MGIVYSKDQDRVKKAKNLRIQAGSDLQSTSEAEISHDIIDTMPEKMKKHSENVKAGQNFEKKRTYCVSS